jgi:hypothetical protein
MAHTPKCPVIEEHGGGAFFRARLIRSGATYKETPDRLHSTELVSFSGPNRPKPPRTKLSLSSSSEYADYAAHHAAHDAAHRASDRTDRTAARSPSPTAATIGFTGIRG